MSRPSTVAAAILAGVASAAVLALGYAAANALADLAASVAGESLVTVLRLLLIFGG
jgi:hypothetical protein